MRPPLSQYAWLSAYSCTRSPTYLSVSSSLYSNRAHFVALSQVGITHYASTISSRLGRLPGAETSLPSGIQLFKAKPLNVQKSVFVGRACKLDDPAQIPLILTWVLQEKSVAKATHPLIHAWRCNVDGTVHEGSDDDGETAAGGRLASLMELMGVDNALVIVTRYFGGTKLGPSRFKYITQVGKEALEIGGLVSKCPSNAPAGSSKKRR